jgi:hypothetical protein
MRKSGVSNFRLSSKNSRFPQSKSRITLDASCNAGFACGERWRPSRIPLQRASFRGAIMGMVLLTNKKIIFFNDKWRSGRDSNPRYAFGVYSLSRRAPSTTRPPLRISLIVSCKSRSVNQATNQIALDVVGPSGTFWLPQGVLPCPCYQQPEIYIRSDSATASLARSELTMRVRCATSFTSRSTS